MNASTLPRLCLVSDLWGSQRVEWFDLYRGHLKDHFEIEFLDACALGGIDISDYTEEALHKQFVSGGIDKAAEYLANSGKSYKVILGMSVGGVIAWRAACLGLQTQKLIAVSSTRLRKETQAPACSISLHFGEADKHQPDSKWYNHLKLTATIWTGKGHIMYQEADVVEKLCAEIIKGRQGLKPCRPW